MGKRSNFARKARDYYPTPYEAIIPLLPHLADGTAFYEPCAGDGRLVDHLELHGHICRGAYDIEPQNRNVLYGDVLTGVDGFVITNPPWDRKILHPIIELMIGCNGGWLLFDADWMHTKQSIPYIVYCSDIVSVGRVSWMANGVSGFDNCCWYKFDPHVRGTRFHGRAKK